ncbi:MAG: ABC transporter, partial [bacterium]
FISSFVIIFILFLLDKIVFFFPGFLATLLEFLSIDYHFNNIARGVLDTRDLIYYFSLIGLFLFLTIQSLESRKWK